jgi:hypothetical protein
MCSQTGDKLLPGLRRPGCICPGPHRPLYVRFRKTAVFRLPRALCYTPDMRERIRAVMRFSGPRMLLHHPWLALMHLVDGLR